MAFSFPDRLHSSVRPLSSFSRRHRISRRSPFHLTVPSLAQASSRFFRGDSLGVLKCVDPRDEAT